VSTLAMPRLGMGTWHMGERAKYRAAEVAALRLGLDLGVTLVDTAEMYGDGGAERIVGEAIRGRRDDVYLVTKFYPHHAGRRELVAACEGSLRRLEVETVDLYLLHWRGGVPFAAMVETLELLAAAGKIRRWGVSNLDVADVDEIVRAPRGERLAANQVLYNLARRGVEYDLLPWCAAHGVDVMAYSPLDEGPLASHPTLRTIAKRLEATPAQVAIAWLLRRPEVAVIPKATRPEHVRANAAARELVLDTETLAALDRAFPAPRAKRVLEMI
jgi:diketogulonate reductase-like aldo/keto reductase